MTYNFTPIASWTSHVFRQLCYYYCQRPSSLIVAWKSRCQIKRYGWNQNREWKAQREVFWTDNSFIFNSEFLRNNTPNLLLFTRKEQADAKKGFCSALVATDKKRNNKRPIPTTNFPVGRHHLQRSRRSESDKEKRSHEIFDEEMHPFFFEVPKCLVKVVAEREKPAQKN